MNKTILKFLPYLFLCLTSLAKAQHDQSRIEKLVASDRSIGDWYGFSTAVSGQYALVGAPMKMKHVAGSDIKESGAAYILQKDKSNHWKEVQKIESADSIPMQWFASSVSLSGDYALVGASGDGNEADKTGQTRKGAAYVFRKNKEDKWIQTQKLFLQIRHAQDNFGKLVCIQGNCAAISAPGFRTNQMPVGARGAVFLYSLNTAGEWKSSDTLLCPYPEVEDFAAAISMDSNQVAVSGANRIYIYHKGSDKKWHRSEILLRGSSNDIGPALSISICRKHLLVGAAGEFGPFDGSEIPATDSVYHYLNMDANGNFKSVFVLNTKQMRDSLHISNERFRKGAVAVEPAEVRKKRFAGAGLAYVYLQDKSGTWNLIQEIHPADRKTDQHFGNTVSISDNLAVIGAFGDPLDEAGLVKNQYSGAAYIFKPDKQGLWKQQLKLTSQKRTAWCKFGFSVSQSGNTVLIGSRFEGTNVQNLDFVKDAGAVYLYDRTNTGQ